MESVESSKHTNLARKRQKQAVPTYC